MSYSNYPQGFPQGIIVRGMPLTQAHPGKVFWVHNDTSYTPDGGIGGNDGNPGTYQKPFSTVAKALTVSTAERGDIIFLMPGFTQNLAAAVTWDSNGVAIVGLGSGDSRPKFVFDATTDINLDGDNMSLVNLRFIASISNVVRGVDVNGTASTVSGCEFTSDVSTVTFNSCIDVSLDNHVIENNFIQLMVAAGGGGGAPLTDLPAEGIELNTGDNCRIEGNILMGDFTIAAISVKGTARGTQILNNTIHSLATESIAGAIDVAASQTGVIDGNNISMLNAAGSVDDVVDAGAMSILRNFGSNVITEAAGIIGTEST